MDMRRLLATGVCCVLILAGCSSGSSEFTIIETEKRINEEYKPNLMVDIKVDGFNATVFIDTDLDISKEQYGKEKSSGQGHIHLYLNDGEKQGISSTPFVIENLSKGIHEVRISLHNNLSLIHI